MLLLRKDAAYSEEEVDRSAWRVRGPQQIFQLCGVRGTKCLFKDVGGIIIALMDLPPLQASTKIRV